MHTDFSETQSCLSTQLASGDLQDLSLATSPLPVKERQILIGSHHNTVITFKVQKLF